MKNSYLDWFWASRRDLLDDVVDMPSNKVHSSTMAGCSLVLTWVSPTELNN